MSTKTLSSRAARQQLYEIVQQDVPFEEKARKALALGEKYLDVANGHLTQIDRETDHWEALVSTDTRDGTFPPGLKLDLNTTYCRRTIESNGPIALHDAPNQGWATDPAFETHGLHCYFGSTLIVDEEPFGTMCFVSTDPRPDPFTESEELFGELVTRMLERELEREQHEAELTKQANLTAVLNRVLRHNLRNDLSIIRGYTQLMADRLDGDHDGNLSRRASDGDTALRTIDELIELSRKARELDRIVATDEQREPRDLTLLVDQVVDSVAGNHPAAEITIDDAETTTVPIRPSFERAIEEVIQNAVKHAGSEPTVRISIESVPNAVEIQIRDNGPGLDEQEIAVLEGGQETPLSHGSGIGLWLVHWIVTSHDGSVSAAITDDGTTMTIEIPRSPETHVTKQLTTLSRARDKYQAAFEEASDAMLLVNDDARIIDANERAAAVYGAHDRQLLGQPLRKFFPDSFDFATAWEAFETSGESHDTVSLTGIDGEHRSVEYTATTDVVPGHHLIISREV